MKKKMMKVMCSLVFGGVFFCFLPSVGFSQPCNAVVGGISYPSMFYEIARQSLQKYFSQSHFFVAKRFISCIINPTTGSNGR